MGFGEGALLGLVQGLTEFLPISSSGHLAIVGTLIGADDPGAAFTAISQLGTEAAVVLYFRRDIARIVSRWALSLAGRVPRSDPDARMGWLVILGTVPIGVLGLAFQDQIETVLRGFVVIGTTLWLFALLLGAADRFGRKERTLDRLTWKHGLLFGLAQSLALVPGVSRSGGTITMGLLLGYTREAAARYSFLLAIPAVVASGLFQLYDELSAGAGVAWGPTVLATVVAFVVGYAVIAWLMRYISTHSYTAFVVYRIALAVVVYALVAFGALPAFNDGFSA
ncbi:undecaprenyl-diphosphate phosphatase [Kineococcus indalonis]|uniref:undecaprenyl-diphosphate phosphatase n=1 Tax=Kineococcus indalonis TaxID=2696566 RepID=UPI001413609A|nr:undecaprenyl-diphosphate phosphatase [Kineococcus indalonis]NAZ88461.1 undecaprenyl-diphosphate phosphatase [Kineococcus indalonis]